MKRFLYAFVSLAVSAASPAWAGQAEVRDAAMNNNCKPKKIELYQQSLGGSGEMVYRVTCDLPKTVGEKTNSDAVDALMISCTQNLCDVLRAVAAEEKK